MGLTRPTSFQVNTIRQQIVDPITVLNQGSTIANIDVGFLMNRNNGVKSNVALYWAESANTFVTGYTSSGGITNANISLTSYANLQTGGVTITPSVALPSTSTGTGALVVTGGVGISGQLNVGANVTVTGNVLPSANVSYDLGSPTQRWKSLWISGSTIYLGDTTISSNSGGISVPGDVSTTGNFIATGNLSIGGVDINSTGSNLQVVGDMSATGNVSTTNIQATSINTTGNVTANGNLNVSGVVTTDSHLNVAGQLTAQGNVNVTGQYLGLSSGNFAEDNDADTKTWILRATTTNEVETELFIDGVSTRIPVGYNRTLTYDIYVVGRRTDSVGFSAGWNIKGVIDNYNGVTADVGNLTEVNIAADDPDWLVDVRTNDVTDTLNIYVTGKVGQTIRWVAYVRTVEVGQ